MRLILNLKINSFKFMHIIGIRLDGGKEAVIKNLKPGWYPFGDYVEPKSENNFVWRKSGTMADDLYRISDDLPKTISVSCIVGANGSGKSTLLELIFRIINNFSCRSLPNNGDYKGRKLTFMSGLKAQLYFETDGRVGSILNDDDDIRYFYGITKSGKLREDKGSFVGRSSVLKNFFYTICTNYSIYSLNDDDYDPMDILNGEKRNVNGEWLYGLFHKNDGYLAPITMTPYREKGGIINVTNEKDLARQRLMTLFLLFESQNKSFINGYRPLQLEYCFNKNYIRDTLRVYKNKVRSVLEPSDVDNLIEAFSICWRKIIEEDLKNSAYISQPNIEETILFYLGYKTLKICMTYESFGRKINIKAFSKISSFEEEQISSVIELIRSNREDNHITLKINQCLTFLKRSYWRVDKKMSANAKNFIKYNLDFDNKDLLNEDKKVKRYDSYDQVFKLLPPPFFFCDMTLYHEDKSNETKKALKEEIRLSQLSSGEKQMLFSLSYVMYHIKNIESVTEDRYRIPYHHINLIFDEAELYFHPEFQRSFVSDLLKMISWCHIDGRKIRSINIMIVTHSPFVLSDIPLENILYLEDGRHVKKIQQTFSANIHEILQSHFFMKYPMGEIARRVLDHIISLHSKKDEEKDRVQNDLNKNKDYYSYVVSIIADPYLKSTIHKMLNELYSLGETPLQKLKREREETESKLKNIDNWIAEIEKDEKN